MQHRCKVTVLETKCFSDLQEKYLADPKSGPCPCYHAGDEYIFDRNSEKDDFSDQKVHWTFCLDA